MNTAARPPHPARSTVFILATRLFAFIILALTLSGCASAPFVQDPSRPGLPPATVESWPNPYANDPNLAAVCILRASADPFDQWGFVYRRPVSAAFAFWDGRVRQIQFRGDGTVWDDFWWPPNARLKPGSAAWAGFNFFYGSDPTFLMHRDPRLPIISGHT